MAVTGGAKTAFLYMDSPIDARRIIRKEWLKEMIENGIEESDFAFDDEEALSDEDKQAFLSEIEKKKDSLKYIGAE